MDKMNQSKIRINPYNITYRSKPEFTFVDLLHFLKNKKFFHNEYEHIIDLMQLCVCYDEFTNIYKVYMNENGEDILFKRQAFLAYSFKRISLGKEDIDIIKLSHFFNDTLDEIKIKYYLSISKDAREFNDFYSNSDEEHGIVFNNIPNKMLGYMCDTQEKKNVFIFKILLKKYLVVSSESNRDHCINLKKMYLNMNEDDKLAMSNVIGKFSDQKFFTQNIRKFISDPRYYNQFDYETRIGKDGKVQGMHGREPILYSKSHV